MTFVYVYKIGCLCISKFPGIKLYLAVDFDLDVGDSDQLLHIIAFGVGLMILIWAHFYYLHVSLREGTLWTYCDFTCKSEYWGDYVSRWKNCLSYIFLFLLYIFLELTGSDEKLAKNISWNSRNSFLFCCVEGTCSVHFVLLFITFSDHDSWPIMK